MPIHRRTVLRSGALTVAGALAGCSSGGGDSEKNMGDKGSGTTVTMVDTSFDPLRLEVSPGTEVTWTNQDAYKHDVTSAQFHDAATSWNFEKTVPAGESVSHTFEQKGIYEYYCTIHGEGTMCGAVLVGDVSLSKSLPCGSDSGGGGGGYSSR